MQDLKLKEDKSKPFIEVKCIQFLKFKFSSLKHKAEIQLQPKYLLDGWLKMGN